jgi:hypothetical protein
MSEQGSDNTAVKIVAIIGGVIIVIVASCGVMGYFLIKEGTKAFQETMGKTLEAVEEMTQDMQQSQGIADSFLVEIQTDNIEGAYQSTTEAYRKRMSQKAFEELVKKHPALKEPPVNMGLDPNSPIVPPIAAPAGPNGAPSTRQATTNTYRYRFHVQSKDGKDSIDLMVGVKKVEGELKVDEFTIKKAAAKDEGPVQP